MQTLTHRFTHTHTLKHTHSREVPEGKDNYHTPGSAPAPTRTNALTHTHSDTHSDTHTHIVLRTHTHTHTHTQRLGRLWGSWRDCQKVSNIVREVAMHVVRGGTDLHKAVYNESIPLQENVRNLRMFDAKVVQLYQPSSTRCIKNPLFLGDNLWNALPVDVRTIEDLL